MGKILHIDWLDKNVKSVLKTLFDANIAHVIRMYGFDYVTPRWGEPIFVPFDELAGRFRNTKSAYEKIMQKVKENKDIGLSIYRNWFPNYIYYDYYRFVEYSFSDIKSGITVGFAAEPMVATDKTPFELEAIVGQIKGKRVYISNQALLGNIIAKGPIMNAKEVKMGDEVMQRRDEIIEFYNWINDYRHTRYDKENVYDKEIALDYMTKGFELLDTLRRSYITDEPEGEIAIVPIFVIPKRKRTNAKGIKEAWTTDLKEFLDAAMFHEIEPTPVIMSYSVINQELEKLKGFDTIIALFDSSVKRLDKCDECPELLKSFKVKAETDKVKILSS